MTIIINVNQEIPKKYFKNLSKGTERKIFELAKSRRQNQTPAEKILWEKLRTKKLGGYKFRRQHPILNYIADFYCSSKMLVIEVDGKYHNEEEQSKNDRIRTEALNGKNIKVLRFTNEQVLFYTDKMLETILEFLQKSPDL